jgi:flagellar hook-basal body protein
MENTLLIGLSRQMALRRELDVVANNIANLNTTGFKADGNIFHEHLMPVARSERFSGADRRLSYVMDRATWHDFSQGPLQQTGNPLDLAVDGKAFLAVDTPRGERYTRNGALQINAQGELVTTEGFRVLGENGRTATSRSGATAPSRCARASTPRTRGCAASCGSSSSRNRSGCARTAPACSPRPTA